MIIKNGALKEYDFEKRKYLIITDDNIPLEYVDLVKEKTRAFVFTMHAGEESKNLETYKAIVSFLLQYNFSRNDCLIALGGGVVGDITGFVAASYMRGMDYIQIPTSLIGQVDSAIGGKTALDFEAKNTIGFFYDPIEIIIDPSLLKSLPEIEYKNGLGEVIKYALLFDEELYKMLFTNFEIEEVVKRCANLKVKIVNLDKKDVGVRHVLNFGHTLGHAIEMAYNLKHGFCVISGMKVFSKFDFSPLLRILEIDPFLSYNKDIVFEYLTKDKKRSGENKIKVILLNDICDYEIKELTFDELKGMI